MFNPGKSILNYCATLRQHVLPALCLLCLAPAKAGNLCAACRHDLPFLPDEQCPQCAAPSLSGQVCGACLSDPPAFDRAFAPCAYAFPIDRVIQSFKYAGNLAAAPMLAELMLASVGSAPKPDVIIPLPLSQERARERGFNQSLELARLLAAAMDIPLAPAACVRVRHAAAQSALPWPARASNVRGAFVCMEDMRGRSVAIVDDVLTTGATMSELARVIRLRGATQVSAWVAARTLSRMS